LLWEATALNGLIRKEGIDLVFSASGAISPNCRAPQATMAMNPWCFVPRLHRTSRERLRAYLQRRTYRHAAEQAATVVYISEHIRDKYTANARRQRAGSSLIAYSGIDDATFEAAGKLRGTERKELRILAVSAMAHWKNVEAIVGAVRRLRDRSVAAQLDLVGPWPDATYRRFSESEIARLDLAPHVEIAGKVSKEQLHKHYASAGVFCLMSRCESFGIPAVEAQAFGTPVVASLGCAMPEVCGAGGLYGPPDDVQQLTELLGSVQTDAGRWNSLSAAARANSQKYRWERCSAALLPMLELASMQAA